MLRSKSNNNEMEDAHREATELKSQILAKMSREISAPVNNIIGFAELALKSDIPEEVRELLGSISQSAIWLLDIIDEILDLSIIDTEKTIDTEKNELERVPTATKIDIKKPMFEGEVLVCESGEMNQQIICHHLERIGIKPVVAGNGKEGLDIIKSRLQSGEKPFDLIFMDTHMPIMDGQEATSQIAKLGVQTPIVTLTANNVSSEMENYLVKPFTSPQLWNCLAKHLPLSNPKSNPQETPTTKPQQTPGGSA